MSAPVDCQEESFWRMQETGVRGFKGRRDSQRGRVRRALSICQISEQYVSGRMPYHLKRSVKPIPSTIKPTPSKGSALPLRARLNTRLTIYMMAPIRNIIAPIPRFPRFMSASLKSCHGYCERSIDLNRNHRALSFSELAENVSDPFQQPILSIENLMAFRCRRGIGDSSRCVNPRAFRPAANITGHYSHARIVAYSFHLACIGERIDKNHTAFFGKPHGRGDRRAVLPVALKAQVFLICKLSQFFAAHSSYQKVIDRSLKA
jgi:hypothetical protein